MHAWLIMVREHTGIPPMIYTSQGLWNIYMNNGYHSWAKDYPLWICDYVNDEPKIPVDWQDVGYEYWQYSGNGNGMGAYYGTQSSSVDLNVERG